MTRLIFEVYDSDKLVEAFFSSKEAYAFAEAHGYDVVIFYR